MGAGSDSSVVSAAGSSKSRAQLRIRKARMMAIAEKLKEEERERIAIHARLAIQFPEIFKVRPLASEGQYKIPEIFMQVQFQDLVSMGADIQLYYGHQTSIAIQMVSLILHNPKPL